MSISFRPLTKEDLPTLRTWLETPHVKEWWRDDVETSIKEYGKEIEEGSATSFFVIVVDGRSVGMIQSYRVDAYDEYRAGVRIDDAAAVDLLIGNTSLTGSGLGPRVLSAFVEQVVKHRYPEARFLVASPSVHNVRSIRAFEKAGFVKKHVAHFPSEPDPEQVMALEIRSASGV
jgi:aminoglycoside 6'-N-acetyltransferase